MRKERAKVLQAYHNQSRVLFAHTRSGVVLDKAGQPCRAMNGFASSFWAGFDGMASGVRVPSRSSIAWDWYMAGCTARRITLKVAK